MAKFVLTKMNAIGLPFELYQLILEFLNLPDLLRLRLVNKFFRDVVKEYRAKELCFYRGKLTNHRFFLMFQEFYVDHHFENISCMDVYSTTNLISSKNLHLLKEPLFNIEYLKRLEIHFGYDEDRLYAIADSHINSLIHLEEFRVSFYSEFANLFQCLKWRLVLPKLKVLGLANFRTFPSSFKVNAPHLHSLKLEYLNNDLNVNFDDPSSVKSLSVHSVPYETEDIIDLKN